MLSSRVVFVVIIQRREVFLVLLVVPLPRKSGLSVVDESELKVRIRLRRRRESVTIVDVRQSAALALRRSRSSDGGRRRRSLVVTRTLPVHCLRRHTAHVEVVVLVEGVLRERRDREPRKKSRGLAPSDFATVRANLFFGNVAGRDFPS